MIEQEIQLVLWEVESLPYKERLSKLTVLFRRAEDVFTSVFLPIFSTCDEGYGIGEGYGLGRPFEKRHSYGFGSGFGLSSEADYGCGYEEGDGYGSRYTAGGEFGSGFGDAYGFGDD